MTAIARVSLNGVEIGSVPREVYDGLVKDVRRERRLYFAYGANLVRAVVRQVLTIVRALPGLVFFLGALVALADPQVFAQIIASFREAPPAEIAEGVRRFLGFALLTLGFACPLVAIIFPATAKIDSPFEKEVCDRLRRLLEVPAEGDLTVCFYADGKG